MVDKRSKSLPEGYICKACGSSEHSIHDCSNKITSKKQKVSNNNNNEVASSLTSEHIKEEITQTKKSSSSVAPTESSHIEKYSSKKAYVSGLPFHITKLKLKEILENASCDVAHITLSCFTDNPSKCKGVAFVTFRDEESVQKAIELTGTEMEGKVLKVEAFKSDLSTTSISKTSDKPQGTSNKLADNKRCYRCGGKHDAKTCTNARICYRCKSADHLSFDCPQKKPVANPRKKVFNDNEV